MSVFIPMWFFRALGIYLAAMLFTLPFYKGEFSWPERVAIAAAWPLIIVLEFPSFIKHIQDEYLPISGMYRYYFVHEFKGASKTQIVRIDKRLVNETGWTKAVVRFHIRNILKTHGYKPGEAIAEHDEQWRREVEKLDYE